MEVFFLHTNLEYWNVLPLVDDPLINGLRSNKVDHLAENDPIVHLLVQVAPVLAEPHLVPQVLVLAQVVVDPVREGRLLLIEDHVDGPHLPIYPDPVPVVLLAGLEGSPDILLGQFVTQTLELGFG